MTEETRSQSEYKKQKRDSMMRDFWLAFAEGKQRELLKTVIKQKFKTQIAFAEFLGASRISVQNWQYEKTRLPKHVFEQICKIAPEYKRFALFISGEYCHKDNAKKGQEGYLKKMKALHEKMNTAFATKNTKEMKNCLEALTKDRKSKKEANLTSSELNTLQKVNFDTSFVDFSWKDSVKGIILPKELSLDLCYVVGAHIGDGCMNIYRRKKQVDYYYNCGGHPINDKYWYDNILAPLKKKLFNLQLEAKNCSDGTYSIQFRSKAVVTFYNKCVGLPLGKKSAIIDIPQIILGAGMPYILACISGIFDTDFALTFKNKNNTVHSYPFIELKVKSNHLVKTISRILTKIGISHSKGKCSEFDARIGKDINLHRVSLSGRINIDKWFELIGSRNPNYLSKYQIWKRFGFCPPRLNYYQRKEILDGIKNPLEYYNAPGVI